MCEFPTYLKRRFLDFGEIEMLKCRFVTWAMLSGSHSALAPSLALLIIGTISLE